MVDILANLLPGSNLPIGVNVSLPVPVGTTSTTVPLGPLGSIGLNGAANGSGVGASVGDSGLGVLLPGGTGSSGALDLGALGDLGGLIDLGSLTGGGSGGGSGGTGSTNGLLGDLVPNLLSTLNTTGLVAVTDTATGGTTIALPVLGGTDPVSVTVPNILGGLLGPVTTPSTGGALPSVYDAYANIFRTWTAPAPEIKVQLDALKAMVDAGQITQTQALLQIVHAAAPFTGLAAATYQFFTGKAPSTEGLTYLVNSTQNATDLNDPYYEPFNTENRYINFASNLGLHGEGAAEFRSDYGSLSFEQAVQKAYGEIVGAASINGGFASGSAVNDIIGRKGYFQQVASERFGNDNPDLALKLTAIGYILQESVRAGVGLYGDSVENFLFDLADGDAQANVDLVGTYGPLTTLNVD